MDLRKFFSYYKPYKGLLAADLISSAMVAALSLAIPACVRYITKNILESGSVVVLDQDVLFQILRVGLLMLAIILVQSVFAVFYDYKGHEMGARIERDMRMELFEHYQRLSLKFHDGRQPGELMSRLTNDLLNLAELCHHGPENIVVYGTQFIGSLIILSFINLKLALVVCVILPVMAYYSFVFYKKLQDSYRISKERISDVNARALENLSGIRVVKNFANEGLEITKFKKDNDSFYQSRSDIYKREAMHYTVIEKFFTQLITVAIVVAGGIWIADGSLAVVELLTFIMYAAYLTAPIPSLAFMVQQYQEGLTGYRRFREIVDIVPDIRDAENAAELRITEGIICFDDVTFGYNDDKEYVLRKINLQTKPGETIAVVGRSGIGKTTLCALIPRLYEASSGDIRIDGVSIRDVSISSLRRQIGVVGQETFLFAGTVLENIMYGKPDATLREVMAAAKKANAHEFITALPNGYETDIGHRGVRLSGGQRQRLSIARVFLKNPRILIFDEATSALDYESERSVIDSMKALSSGRTAFIIAHRLSTVRNADRIIVLTSDGIAEEGTHEQLYKLNGEYAKLYNAQES